MSEIHESETGDHGPRQEPWVTPLADGENDEHERRDTEALRASMLETALDAIITMDHRGHIVEFNPAAEQIFGYDREQVLGREMAKLIIPQEQREQHRAGLARYLATGEGLLIGRRLEITAQRADGMLFPAEVAITRAPLDGPPLFTGYIRDISEQRRIEKALQASEERLRTVVANAPLVLFAVNGDGIFTLSEGQGLSALGIKPDEHVGQSYFTLYNHLPDSVKSMRRALAGERVTTIERFKGLVFETRWTPVRNAAGTVEGVTGVSTDITERSKNEEERAKLLERERAARAAAVSEAAEREAVFEAISDGVFTFNQQGILLRTNRSFNKLVGLSREKEPGFSALSLPARGERLLMRDIDGQPLPRDRWPVSRILNGEVLTGGQLDILVQTLDGREVLLGMSGAPLYDELGRLIGGVCLCRDVTEQRRLERRTHEALDALLAMAAAMAQVPDETTGSSIPTQSIALRIGMLTLDVLNCRSVSIIAMTKAGVPQALECVGLPDEQLTRWRERIAQWPRDTVLYNAIVTRLRAGETLLIDTTTAEYRAMTNPFGIERYLLAPMLIGSILVGLLSVDYGSDHDASSPEDLALVEGVAKLAALVLERERLQQEREEARGSAMALREANRRMDEFLGIAGHEMRTPLTSIMANLQLVQRRLARLLEHQNTQFEDSSRDPLEIRRMLERTEVQVRRIGHLVDDMVDVSRIQAGHLAIRRRRCDVAEIVREIVHEQRELVPGRTILLVGDDATIAVDADPDRIGQVVTNYLTNALKYADEERPITVGLLVEGVITRVWVQDEGPGLAHDEQDRIWELFYRVDGVGHRHGSSVGLGMGLHICRTIIEQHGGHVGVTSVPGEGATFWFTLPRALQ